MTGVRIAARATTAGARTDTSDCDDWHPPVGARSDGAGEAVAALREGHTRCVAGCRNHSQHLKVQRALDDSIPVGLGKELCRESVGLQA